MRFPSRSIKNVVACSLVFLALAPLGSFAGDDWYDAKKTGGALTVYSFGESPYNHAAPFLELEERRVFSNGALAFRNSHPIDGLSSVESGPPIEADYNARSCESCHPSDGRGISHTEAFDSTGFSVKASSHHSVPPVFRNILVPSVSQKLQGVEWETKQQITLGGQLVELVAPVAIVDGEKRLVDLRNAPGVYGLGLLEAISDDEIRKAAEKQEFSAFGVRGIVGTACEQRASNSCDKVGRFGWKATVSNLNMQTRSALAGELSIHQPIPKETAPNARSEYDRLVTDLAEYLKVLAVPARRLDNANENARGARLFEEAGCAMCHRPSLQTSSREDTDKRVRGQRIYPFTDMLLHDMGEALADSNDDGLSRYWRTPALWGIGMQGTVSEKVGYLHDGRARNFLEAILWHGGEATYSVSRFKDLPKDDRDRLVAFLSSL
ncbi:c-type cytochrome [Mesorhizobium sp. M0152]|uniref:di-heme oxidoredictase family protein n=1 Tax=Mesorhizobium sp. M0152 TaxID=2956898 RepID=UPI00333C3E2B